MAGRGSVGVVLLRRKEEVVGGSRADQCDIGFIPGAVA